MIGNKKIKLNKKKSLKPAFTLIEVLVSVSLFVVIIISVTGIFKLLIDAQRNALSSQNVQESLKYFLEVVAKEMRMAQKDKGFCNSDPLDDNQVFFISGNGGLLRFRNSYGDCVTYGVATYEGVNRFNIIRDTTDGYSSGFISPAKINIDSLQFVLRGGYPETQPIITINLKASAFNENRFNSQMVIQTSVTSRYYK